MIKSNASSGTYLRTMRNSGCHPDQLTRPTPHTEMRSLHPNHVWQFDVSVCVLYYLDKGGLAVMDEKRFYKNKPANVARVAKQRVLRYLVTDHFTGTLYVHYFQAAGEDQETLFEFLMTAFAERPHEQDPFHGVPLMLVWDAGSANQSYLIRNLLDRLQVKHWAHEPGRPRAKGQVEKTHDLIERDFEGRLFLVNIQSIEELNAKAHAWMRAYNANRIHRRTGTTRYGLWQTIRAEQLRICPPRELCEQLLSTKPETRQVKGNLVVTYAMKGCAPETYSVEHVPGVRVGESVSVCVNPYQAPNILVLLEDEDGQEVAYECAPQGHNEAGFPVDAPIFGESYAAKPDTDTDRHRKQMAKDAYGAETQQEVDLARARREPAFGGKVDPFSYLEDQVVASYMRRPGTELDLPHAVHPERQPLSIIEALKRLRARLDRPLTKAESAAVRETYPNGVPEDELERIAAWMEGKTLPDAELSVTAS
ncbi:DDE-type integrase/transposase/recombinase [Sedimenticola selenatireducens]|uniref:DDE-type integrase/transposase/recombinase n=1 Tax=Sedimenticola selenatireducens TaxID=191960 RepID=UPI0004AE96AD|nr:DDE-type integrase/transposase/recombinase [Sedimenticola selenatireducens]